MDDSMSGRRPVGEKRELQIDPSSIRAARGAAEVLRIITEGGAASLKSGDEFSALLGITAKEARPFWRLHLFSCNLETVLIVLSNREESPLGSGAPPPDSG